MEYVDAESMECVESVECVDSLPPECIEWVAYFAHGLNKIAQELPDEQHDQLAGRLLRTCREFRNEPPVLRVANRFAEYPEFAHFAPLLRQQSVPAPTRPDSRKRPAEADPEVDDGDESSQEKAPSPSPSHKNNKRLRKAEQENRQKLREIWVARNSITGNSSECYCPFLDGPNIKEIVKINAKGIICKIVFPVNVANAPDRRTLIPFSLDLSSSSKGSFSKEMDKAYERCDTSKWKAKCRQNLKRLLKNELKNFVGMTYSSDPAKRKLVYDLNGFLTRNNLGSLK